MRLDVNWDYRNRNVLIDLRSSPEKPALKHLAEHQTAPLSATAPPGGRLGDRVSAANWTKVQENGKVGGKNTLSHRNPKKSTMISEFRAAS